jgi:hypothetical protein
MKLENVFHCYDYAIGKLRTEIGNIELCRIEWSNVPEIIKELQGAYEWHIKEQSDFLTPNEEIK